jgi:hypothetical protein
MSQDTFDSSPSDVFESSGRASVQTLESNPALPILTLARAFCFGMGARVVRFTSGVVNANPVVVRPFVVLAAKFLGPGPLRVKMVKLAHELDDLLERRTAA